MKGIVQNYTMKAILLFVLVCHLQCDVSGDEEFTHEMSLHPDYHMWWMFDEQYITVKVKVKTTGWVGWGLSQKGRMNGADMVMGWVDSQGVKHFQDRHGRGNFEPITDAHQDYQLLQMSEEAGNTSFTFKRKIHLGDKDDFTITGDTIRILWSWNDADPNDEDGAQGHGANRGVRSAYLLDYGDLKKQPFPKTYKTFDVTMDTLNVPARETVYWCKIVKLPDMGTKKQHLFRADPVIEKGNEPFVHHMLIFRCNGISQNRLGKQGHCGIRNMPEYDCTLITIYAWAVGGGPFYMPPNSGISLNTPDDPKFFLLETHYDNPRKRRDIVDSSGVRFYYTEELRKHDASVLQVGISPTYRYSQIIPQQVESFTSYGFCPAACLDGGLENGVRPVIYAVGLHTHVHGTKVVVRLMNETSGREVKTVAQDLNYDFNYQEMRYLKEPIEIPAGHRLDVECTLNTMDLNKPLLNGQGTKEEMCLAYLLVSPRPPMSGCLSTSTNNWMWGANNLGWNVNILNAKLLSPITFNGRRYTERGYEPLLESEFWKDNMTRVRSFEKSGEVDIYGYGCSFLDSRLDQRSAAVNKPRVLLDDVDKSSGVRQVPMKWWMIVLVVYSFVYAVFT